MGRLDAGTLVGQGGGSGRPHEAEFDIQFSEYDHLHALYILHKWEMKETVNTSKSSRSISLMPDQTNESSIGQSITIHARQQKLSKPPYAISLIVTKKEYE